MKTTETPKKKETVRISKKDLLNLLSENEHLTKQIAELQSRMSEMLEEIRVLKAEKVPVLEPEVPIEIEPKELTPKDIKEIRKAVRDSQRFFPRSNIYFDGK